MISIIIVNFHNEQLVKQCIFSIYKFEENNELEIIVVNNGGNLKYLKQSCKNVKIIDANNNLGFSTANNIGIKHATGEFILFLNPDTYFIEPILEKVKLDFISQNKCGIIGCKLLNIDKTLQLSYHDGNNFFSKLFYRNPFAIKWFNASHYKNKASTSIKNLHKIKHFAPWLSGAFIFMSKKDIFNHNLFWDETFFMYWEDVDLCYRVKKSGFKIIYTPEYGIVHIGGSGENVSASRFEYIEDSKLILVNKRSRFLKFLYITAIKIELQLEKYLEKRKKIKIIDPNLLNEINYYETKKYLKSNKHNLCK